MTHFYRDLIAFKKIDKKVATLCTKVLQRHTWYLSQENITFALFDDSLPLSTREQLATAIVEKTSSAGDIVIKKPELPQIDESSALTDFVGPRSRLIFDLVGVSTDFLKEDRWHLTADYNKIKSTLNNISSTNDSAERAIALMTTYNTRITRTESSFKELVQVVEDHRSTFSFSTKEGLRNFY